jgi:hypothetical protein
MPLTNDCVGGDGTMRPTPTLWGVHPLLSHEKERIRNELHVETNSMRGASVSRCCDSSPNFHPRMSRIPVSFERAASGGIGPVAGAG